MSAEPVLKGRERREHWTSKGDVRLFLWEKAASSAPAPRGTIPYIMRTRGVETFHFFQPPVPVYRGA